MALTAYIGLVAWIAVIQAQVQISLSVDYYGEYFTDFNRPTVD